MQASQTGIERTRRGYALSERWNSLVSCKSISRLCKVTWLQLMARKLVNTMASFTTPSASVMDWTWEARLDPKLIISQKSESKLTPSSLQKGETIEPCTRASLQ